MPIKPENKHRYPKDWKKIRARILERASHRCEQCWVPNYAYRNRSTGEWTTNQMQVETWTCVDGDKATHIVLTIAHLDHTPENCADDNLRALCQRCHLAYDVEHHKHTSNETRRKGKAVSDMFSV
jgi:5-methylcytosine-specific restriction endonuclease McrA